MFTFSDWQNQVVEALEAKKVLYNFNDNDNVVALSRSDIDFSKKHVTVKVALLFWEGYDYVSVQWRDSADRLIWETQPLTDIDYAIYLYTSECVKVLKELLNVYNHMGVGNATLEERYNLLFMKSWAQIDESDFYQ